MEINRKVWNEFKRLFPLLATIIMSILIFGDAPQLSVQLYKLSMVALVIGAFHIIRKSLFPYIDLRKIYLLARKDAIGASIIFLSIIAFLIAVIVVSVV